MRLLLDHTLNQDIIGVTVLMKHVSKTSWIWSEEIAVKQYFLTNHDKRGLS